MFLYRVNPGRKPRSLRVGFPKGSVRSLPFVAVARTCFAQAKYHQEIKILSMLLSIFGICLWVLVELVLGDLNKLEGETFLDYFF